MAAGGFVYEPGAPDFQDRMFEIYRTMRDDFPVYRHPDGHVVLTRFDDVLLATHDVQRFSNDVAEARGFLPMMIYQDPPRHTALRALVSRAFTPKRIAAVGDRVRTVTNDLLDDLDPARCDFLHEFALLLPSIVVGEMIGVPKDLLEPFRLWTESFLTVADDTSAAGKIYELFAGLLAERRIGPRDDLMSALLGAEVDGEQLSEQELLGFCFLLVLGGNDTTTSLLANGAELLARHPSQRAELAADPALVPNAVEEMLRMAAPTQALPRTALVDVDLHGETIEAGTRVMVVFGAANLDDREFADPERFDVHRRIGRHLAFGHGPHFCLGAPLARLEARVAFEELLRRYPRYELAEPPQRLRSIWARTFESVPLTLEPTA